jgi:hypothetical protein
MGELFFLKQYGERRTGTNALRALIAANFPNVVVLMHLLGDKHSPPVALDALWREVQWRDDAAFELVSRATFDAPSLTTVRNDRRQLAEVRRWAAPVAEAHANGTLGWVISIRDPYAWALSVARFLGWATRRVLPDGRADDVRAACARFNESYAAWLALAESRTLVVRHEDLVRDPEAVVRTLAQKFGCERAPEFVAVDRVVEPAIWDGMAMPTQMLPYDREHYAGEGHVSGLPALHRDVVTETIDWELVRPFGYAPRDSARLANS